MMAARIAPRKGAHLTHTGLRTGTFPLVLLRPIPGSRHTPSYPPTPFPLGRLSPTASKKQILPARACSILNRHDPCGNQIPIEPAAP